MKIMERQDRTTRVVRILTLFFVGWLIAQLTLFGVRYFFPSKFAPATETVKSGQRVETLPAPYMCQPVKTEVDFIDAPVTGVEEKIDLGLGDGGKAEFSSFGGCLDRATLVKRLDGHNSELVMIGAHTGKEREELPFLIALDEKTPFFYKKASNIAPVAFVSETDQVRITKVFTTSGSVINLDLTVEPLVAGAKIQPRLFFPTPLLEELGDRNMVSAFVWGSRGKLEKILPNQITGAAWASPEIFGLQNRYFAFGLVKDVDKFTRRAYFKHAPNGNLAAILEGPEIVAKTTWHLSFYLGQKESGAFAAVDSRLDGLLEYGWFSWVAKGLMFLLDYINNYVHNYGWSIILLTLLINILLLPLTWKNDQKVNDSGEYMRKMKYIDSRYADDPERMRVEKLELVKKYGAFPGMSGCLPLLIQMPILIGLSSALRNAFELYHAPFMLWLQDLSAQDPYYILPILLGVSIFFSVSANAKNARQYVMYVFVILLSIGFMINVSSGLALYLTVSGLLRMLFSKLAKSCKRA